MTRLTLEAAHQLLPCQVVFGGLVPIIAAQHTLFTGITWRSDASAAALAYGGRVSEAYHAGGIVGI